MTTIPLLLTVGLTIYAREHSVKQTVFQGNMSKAQIAVVDRFSIALHKHPNNGTIVIFASPNCGGCVAALPRIIDLILGESGKQSESMPNILLLLVGDPTNTLNQTAASILHDQSDLARIKMVFTELQRCSGKRQSECIQQIAETCAWGKNIESDTLSSTWRLAKEIHLSGFPTYHYMSPDGTQRLIKQAEVVKLIQSK